MKYNLRNECESGAIYSAQVNNWCNKIETNQYIKTRTFENKISAYIWAIFNI